MIDADIWAGAGRWFDRDWYLGRNPDVLRVGRDPLAHYLRYGEAEGRRPSPWFNPAWYRAAYDIPPDQSALAHFLARRTTGAFLPSPELYLVPLSAPWGEDSSVGVDAFHHFLTGTSIPERELLPDLTLIQPSGLIDAIYYRINPVHEYE